MYDSVLFEWLERLNIKIKPTCTFYRFVAIQSLSAKDFLDNQILVKSFATFNLKTYRKHGTTYTDLFKTQMKKLFMKSREALALSRLGPLLRYVNNSIGFSLEFQHEEEFIPFLCYMSEEACIVQDFEYEEYIKQFLIEVKEANEAENDFVMDSSFSRYVYSNVRMNLMKRAYILPKEIYMSIGRLALLIHKLKWKQDQQAGLNNKEVLKNSKK